MSWVNKSENPVRPRTHMRETSRTLMRVTLRTLMRVTSRSLMRVVSRTLMRIALRTLMRVASRTIMRVTGTTSNGTESSRPRPGPVRPADALKVIEYFRGGGKAPIWTTQ